MPSNSLAFPTAVGMNRDARRAFAHHISVPHSRGDEPESLNGRFVILRRSPQPWG